MGKHTCQDSGITFTTRDGWVDIKVSMPPPCTQVLFYTKKRQILTGYYELTDTQFFTNEYCVIPQRDVTHWSEMPPPPEDE